MIQRMLTEKNTHVPLKTFVQFTLYVGHLDIDSDGEGVVTEGKP